MSDSLLRPRQVSTHRPPAEMPLKIGARLGERTSSTNVPRRRLRATSSTAEERLLLSIGCLWVPKAAPGKIAVKLRSIPPIPGIMPDRCAQEVLRDARLAVWCSLHHPRDRCRYLQSAAGVEQEAAATRAPARRQTHDHTYAPLQAVADYRGKVANIPASWRCRYAGDVRDEGETRSRLGFSAAFSYQHLAGRNRSSTRRTSSSSIRGCRRRILAGLCDLPIFSQFAELEPCLIETY